MRAYARHYGAAEEDWAIAGMLRDFDYELHPQAPHHPMKGAEKPAGNRPGGRAS